MRSEGPFVAPGAKFVQSGIALLGVIPLNRNDTVPQITHTLTVALLEPLDAVTVKLVATEVETCL
jgi:hypothetical protein